MRKLTSISKALLQLVLVIIFTASIAGWADAGALTFNYDVTFSGTSPAGSAPWLTATFNDATAASGYDVRLTIFAANLDPGNESATHMYFNLDPLLNASLLSFNAVNTSSAAPNSVTGSSNAYKADGDGYYDINFDMPPPPGDFASRFTDNETIVYDIKYSTGGLINASSFNFTSVDGGGTGNYLAAAHIQGVGTTSGWVGSTTVVPEPVSSTLFTIGGVALGFRTFHEKRKRRSGKAISNLHQAEGNEGE